MKIRSFSDRLFTDCGAEFVVFLVGGIAAKIAHTLFLRGGDGYFSGFFAGCRCAQLCCLFCPQSEK